MKSRLILGVALASLIFSSIAHACDCELVPTNPSEFARSRYQKAAVIFRGAVIGVSKPAPNQSNSSLSQGDEYFHAQFEVREWFKGKESPKISVATREGGGDCGMGWELQQHVGKEYLVIANNATSGALHTGICSGTGELVQINQSAEVLNQLRLLRKAGMAENSSGQKLAK